MKKLRVAVVGCGKISCRHLDAASSLDRAELVAVCDTKADRAKTASKKYGVSFYTDYKEMIKTEQLDAVHICTPHFLHGDMSRYALEHGIHVICEKPMSISVQDAESTVELAEQRGLRYGVIFQSRYHPSVRLVKQRINDGRLGRVLCGRVTLTWARSDEYYSSSDWKGTWDMEGGGVVIDQAIHSLDLANWLIDDTSVNVVSSLHNRYHSSICVEDTAEGAVFYRGGQILSFWVMNNYLVNEPIEIRLVCEHGTVNMSYNKAYINYSDGTQESSESVALSPDEKSYWGNKHIAQISNFYGSILGCEELEISGREALKIQKIVFDIYKSNDNPNFAVGDIYK